MTISRRAFVKAGAAAYAGLGVAPLALARARPRPVFVAVHLRGGLDGLSLLVPHGDPDYYAARPRLAIPRGEVLDLDGRFGLHGALAPLWPLWREGHLAAVLAVGSAQPPRSHADACRAVAADVPPPLDPAPTTPFAPSLRRLARLIKADAAPPVAHVTLGGWDTHVNQGTSRGRLAQRLGVLAAGLAGFAAALGPRLRDVVLMTWTEFGRSVRENANGGTDHGAASAALVLGGPVRRGHVVGRWPGLHDETGVAATTGVGELAAELLGRHVDWPPPREGGGAHAAVPGA